MRHLLTFSLALALLASGSTALASEVYRWTDDRGVVHYSDTPPDSNKFERVNVRTGVTTRASELAAEAQPEASDSAQAATPASETAAQRCDNARRNLIALRSTLEVEGEFDGETRVLNAEERQDQIERNEQLAAIHCDSP